MTEPWLVVRRQDQLGLALRKFYLQLSERKSRQKCSLKGRRWDFLIHLSPQEREDFVAFLFEHDGELHDVLSPASLAEFDQFASIAVRLTEAQQSHVVQQLGSESERRQAALGEWQAALQQHWPSAFERLGHERPQHLPHDRPVDILVQQLSLCERLLRENEQLMTEFELSARVFLDAKFIRDHSVLQRMLPELATHCATRPLQLNVWLGTPLNKLLLVENLESFEAAAEQAEQTAWDGAVVYGAGWKVSSDRLFHASGVKCYFRGQMGESEAFTHRWLQKQFEQAYYWGDIDRSGLEIVQQLQQSLPNLALWQRAYHAMLTTSQIDFSMTQQLFMPIKLGQIDALQSIVSQHQLHIPQEVLWCHRLPELP